jgi:hypothetical protein
MFENPEDLFGLIGFAAFVCCYTLNIKLTHLHELQLISSSCSSSIQQYETIQQQQNNQLSKSLSLNFEDLIQVHAATCNYKELSSKSHITCFFVLLYHSSSSLLFLHPLRCCEINFECQLQIITS